MVFGRVFSAPFKLIATARQMVDEFSLVLQRPSGMTRGIVLSRDRWSPPPCGFLKINWDAALDLVKQRTGIGVVIRDEVGGFYAAQAKAIPFVMDPSMAEALGAWIAVKLGCELGLSQVHLEGDAVNVVEALKKLGRAILASFWPSDSGYSGFLLQNALLFCISCASRSQHGSS